MTSMPSLEINFDGLVGSTHHYAGLSRGNVASESNEGELSRPREAALQGLRKMRALWDRGVPQGVFPPQERPHLGALRALGFEGSDAEILAKVARSSPGLLQAMSSASAMWAANAATVAPSADTRDGRVHFTPANLQAKLHRSIESEGTSRMLRRIFRDEAHFAHHAPLPGGANLGDEGAANHTRLHPGGAQGWGGPGLQLFVYGRRYFARPDEPRARRYPARQAREASEAIARLHGLDPAAFILAQQNPEAIDAGVFHNDVI
ncbi:MAG: N-succinylarginine dihydrolase, partial [Myxococcales bacterium]|nr:N-succinylarginine dihydrolase [Myxococcales bacterium]